MQIRDDNSIRALRGTLGGVSLLLAVALVFQASAGLREFRTTVPGRHQDGPDVRQIAQVQVRRSARAVRRQDERPALVVAAAARARLRRGFVAATAGSQVPAVARPAVWLTDLPPPSRA